MLCTIDGEMFYSFTKNMLIGNSGILCHIINDDTGLYGITDIKKMIQGSLGNMPATKKGIFA